MFSVDASVIAKIGNYQKVGYLPLLLKLKKNISTKQIIIVAKAFKFNFV